MGNDGGSIPKRSELVRAAAKALNNTQLKEKLLEQQEFLWTTDPITNTPLQKPIVSDCTGRLYNAETVISFILSKSQGEELNERAQEYLGDSVLSRKDYVEVTFEEDAEAGKKKAKSMNGDNSTSSVTKWICPVSRKPLGPGSKAAYLVTCGHAFAGAALKEIKAEECMQCGKAYQKNDIIPIVPSTPEEATMLEARIKLYRDIGLSHSDRAKKLAKKEKKQDEGHKKRKRHADPEKDADDDGKKKKKHTEITKAAHVPSNSAIAAEA